MFFSYSEHMYLIYWKWKVGSAIAELCRYLEIPYEICDDSDSSASYDRYEVIIPSPGVPSHHAIYQTGKVVSELDFAYQYLPSGFQMIAITGTDGKSTTSAIMYSILEKEFSGKKSVYLSWNFDIPFSATILQSLEKWETEGYIVVEVSSFMAYSLEKFVPDYSIFTNFKPDHLNWHSGIQDYFNAKMNLIHRTRVRSVMNEQIISFAREKNLEIDIPENVRVFSQWWLDSGW
jgi:UDP-N-acetylmuramoylalanine--D-glutamate ligase